MKKLISKTILISIIALIISSCEKHDEASLAGDWEFVYLTANTTGEVQTWAFDGTNKLLVTIEKQDTIMSYSGNYSYNFKTLSKDELELKDVYIYIDGTYKIHKFKDGKLVMERINLPSGNESGAFLWKEFVKK